MAVKNQLGVYYFSCLVPMKVMFLPNGEMEKRMFLSTWKDIPSSHEKSVPLEGLNNPTTDLLVEKFKRYVVVKKKLFVVHNFKDFLIVILITVFK